jgi:hypothetical protein
MIGSLRGKAKGGSVLDELIDYDDLKEGKIVDETEDVVNDETFGSFGNFNPAELPDFFAKTDLNLGSLEDSLEDLNVRDEIETSPQLPQGVTVHQVPPQSVTTLPENKNKPRQMTMAELVSSGSNNSNNSNNAQQNNQSATPNSAPQFPRGAIPQQMYQYALPGPYAMPGPNGMPIPMPVMPGPNGMPVPMMMVPGPNGMPVPMPMPMMALGPNGMPGMMPGMPMMMQPPMQGMPMGGQPPRFPPGMPPPRPPPMYFGNPPNMPPNMPVGQNPNPIAGQDAPANANP